MPHDWEQGETMGEMLAREHAAAYRAYATDFARGQYRAIPSDAESDHRGPEVFTAIEPLTETTATVLE